MRDLQAFLIKRFIYILVLVTVAQSLISFLISQAVMPVVMKVFFPNYQRQSSVGKTDLFIFIICVLLLLIVNAVRMLLPSPLQGMMQWTGERLQDWLGNALPATRSSVVVQEMEGWKAILLFVVLLLLMVCMLLPYILGAITFARIVMAEFHQIQEEREQQQREFDRKRNLMLSDIAHDLRTPVTTVSGYAKALADHMVQEPEKQQEYLDAIQNKSVRIGNLINLLFEYVKLDSEGFTLNGKTLDLCELLRENAAMLYAEMEENGMTLTADIPEETIPVWADELQLSRVVTNLLTNAMQHNPKGTRIGLFAYRELERIYVLVADSGILIPEEQAQHLFDPFTRGDKARVSDGRNGLGLSIVSKIVQMHGWDLKLVQQPQIQHYAKAAGFAKAFVIRMENAGMYSVHSPKLKSGRKEGESMIIIRAMDPYELLWMVLLIVFVLGELATIGLTCIWFAAGALAALVMAMAGVNPVVQFLVFLVVSILLLVATRPWARKYVNAKMQRTNADSLIGENIRISERVSNMDQTGMAVVHGQEWTVRTRNDNEIIEPGEEAKILAISGVKLIVEKV